MGTVLTAISFLDTEGFAQKLVAVPCAPKYGQPPTEKDKKIMKKETWKMVIQILVSILTAMGTALGTVSCMGYNPAL